MKRIKSINEYFNSDVKINNALKENLFTDIFTSDYDETIETLLKKIEIDFNEENLTSESDYEFEYNFNGVIFLVSDDMFFAIPGYSVKIDGEDIKCSYRIARNAFRFLKKKYNVIKKRNKKQHISKLNNDISDVGINLNKYNL